MIWQEVTVGEFLKNRDERFKPNDKKIRGLRRIDKIDFSGQLFLSNKPSNTDMILVRRNDLVISGINVEKGAMCIYDDIENISATIHYSSYEIDKKKIDVNFLKLFLISPEFKDAIKEQVPGGIKTEIKPKHLLPLKIVIPKTLDEQVKIVNNFNSVRERVLEASSEFGTQIGFITKLRQQILQDAIEGKLVPQDPKDEPASVLLEKIKAEKEKLIKEKKLKKSKPLPPIKDEEIPFDIPDNWVWCRLGEIAIIEGRIGWKGLTASEYKKNGPLFISVYSLNYGDYVDFRDAFHISQERYDESPEIMLKENDILICKDGAGIGKVSMVGKLPQQTTINSSLLLIRKLLDLNHKYLYYSLLSPFFQKIVNSRLMGATTPHLYQRDISTFPIALPPLSEQKRIEEIVTELRKKCDELEKEVKQNQNLTQQLLQSALKEALEPKVN